MFIAVTIFIILIFLTVNMFSGGGAPRALREQFYGWYYAEDAVIDSLDKPNSPRAVEKCVNNGIGIKTEIFMSRDRKLFVSAYDNLSKEYGKDIVISQSESEDVAACGVMTFPQFLQMVDGRVPVVAELKVCDSNERLCRHAADAILAYGHENAAVVSFHAGIIAWFKQTEKTIFRGIMSAPAKEFKSLSKVDRFTTGNLVNNSVCRPQFILYRNHPESLLVKFALSLGVVTGVWTVTDAREGKASENKKDMIVCRAFMPEKPNFKDLPAREKTQVEINIEQREAEKEARRMAKLEYKLQQKENKDK